jgi:hypothetical protein
LLIVILLFVLFGLTKSDKYASIEIQDINQGSIDRLYVQPHIRTSEIFLYKSPSEWSEKLLTYSYRGPTQPDYYGDRVSTGIPANHPAY